MNEEADLKIGGYDEPYRGTKEVPATDSEVVVTFEKLFNEFTEFGLKTFKDASPQSSLEKLADEIKEVAFELQHGHKYLATEYVDCMMCILDSAARVGVNTEMLRIAFYKKLQINKARTWVKNDNNTYSHVK